MTQVLAEPRTFVPQEEKKKKPMNMQELWEHSQNARKMAAEFRALKTELEELTRSVSEMERLYLTAKKKRDTLLLNYKRVEGLLAKKKQELPHIFGLDP